MPVWHERTRALREAGDLVVVGITQEQHPDRCRLFAQWHGIDWPILWDPFNLTGSQVVPRFLLVDEHGVVRDPRARSLDDVEAFLAADHAAPPAEALPEVPTGPALRTPSDSDAAWTAIEHALAHPDDVRPTDLEALAAAANGRDPAWRFRLGVAHRLRHDSSARRPGDFQAAIDAWSTALAQRPSQYIWRRRIQLYGPRQDKPYPFYDWVDAAREAILARGEAPLLLDAPLTAAERAAPSGGQPEGALPAPPGGAEGLPADTEGLVEVETALVPDTRRPDGARQLHVRLRPAGGLVAWHVTAESFVLWLEPADAAWRVVPSAQAVAPPSGDEEGLSREEVAMEVGVVPPPGAEEGTVLRGWVLCPICREDDGTCLLLRRDLEIPIPAPRR